MKKIADYIDENRDEIYDYVKDFLETVFNNISDKNGIKNAIIYLPEFIVAIEMYFAELKQ